MKVIRHPVVGRFEMTYAPLVIAAAPGPTRLVHTAEPASATADALHLLTGGAGRGQSHA